MPTKERLTYNRERAFKTVSEAEAFIEGIEFVNDSAIDILGIFERPSIGGNFQVLLFDRDADVTDEHTIRADRLMSDEEREFQR